MNTADMNARSENLDVANTIRAQLGAGCCAMLGAHQFVGDTNSLRFKIKGCKKINVIVIRLDPSDTYTMQFWLVRSGANFKMEMVSECSDVYVDNLKPMIQANTGLYTSL